MAKKKIAFVVDDDHVASKMLEQQLTKVGFDVHCFYAADDALREYVNLQPDLLVTDIIMPGTDGLELIRQLQQVKGVRKCKIAVASSKSYETDRKRAIQLGADLFIAKPFKVEDIEMLTGLLKEKKIEIDFWGVRGTLPVPGESSIEFGGNTSCVSLRLCDQDLIIFDAGSGAKALGDHLGSLSRPIVADYYISHAHWDHINGLPFFMPLYMAGNNFQMHGPVNQEISFKEMISGQMDSIYFPITIERFASQISYHDLREQTIQKERYKIHSKLLNHPGNCLGYKVEYGDISVCYITDNELRSPKDPCYSKAEYERLVAFVSKCDVLITDSTYSNAEYESKIGWGHSSVGNVAQFAHDAKVKNLCLFHHDPDQDDEAILEKFNEAEDHLANLGSDTNCLCPKERERLTVSAKGIKKILKKSAA